jgi:hypothetical protein
MMLRLLEEESSLYPSFLNLEAASSSENPPRVEGSVSFIMSRLSVRRCVSRQNQICPQEKICAFVFPVRNVRRGISLGDGPPGDISPPDSLRQGISLPPARKGLARGGITQSAGTLDQDVKLPTIEPHASAFWPVVDFDSRSFSQQQINVTYRAFHGSSFFQGSGGWSRIGCKELCRSPT